MDKQYVKDLVGKISDIAPGRYGGLLPVVLSWLVDQVSEGGGGGGVQNAGVFLNLARDLSDITYTDAEFDLHFGEGMAAALREGIANKNIVAIRAFSPKGYGGVYFPVSLDGAIFGNKIDDGGYLEGVYQFVLDAEEEGTITINSL